MVKTEVPGKTQGLSPEFGGKTGNLMVLTWEYL